MKYLAPETISKRLRVARQIFLSVPDGGSDPLAKSMATIKYAKRKEEIRARCKHEWTTSRLPEC